MSPSKLVLTGAFVNRCAELLIDWGFGLSKQRKMSQLHLNLEQNASVPKSLYCSAGVLRRIFKSFPSETVMDEKNIQSCRLK